MFRRHSAGLIRHRDSDGPDPKGYVGDQEYYALPAAAFDGNWVENILSSVVGGGGITDKPIGPCPRASWTFALF